MEESVKLKKFSIVYLTLVIGLIFIFPNDYKYLIPNGSNILNSMMIISLGLGYFCYFPSLIKFIKKNIIFSLPFVIILISSIINRTFIMDAVLNIVYVFLFYFIASFFKKYHVEFIKTAEKISFIILLLNMLVMLIYKQPLRYTNTSGRIYFIFEGSIGRLLIINIMLFFVEDTLKCAKYQVFHHIFYLFSMKDVFLSSTVLTGSILLYIYVLLIRRIKNFNSFLKTMMYIYFVSVIGLNFLIVSGNFLPIISKFFHKSITLSDRTIIWTNVLNVIKAHPFIGIGSVYPEFLIKLTNVSGATHAHNQILQILLESGILGLSVYIYYLFRLGKIKKYLKQGSPYIVYIGYLFAVAIMCITTNFFDRFFYLSILCVISYINDET